MIIPVKCFTCGKVLADKYQFYLREVRKIKVELGQDPEKVVYLTKDNVHLTSKTGYDKYFITVGNTRVESADLSGLDSDAKTSDIKRFFKNSMKGRLKSRVLLNNFIEEVA